MLIDEAADLIERTPSIAHVVVDEAQDLSPMEVRAIGRRCATGAATVLGDIAQGTTPWAATSWPELLKHLGKPDAAVRELDVGYRVPRQILDYASRLLPAIAPGLAPARSLRADPAALSVVKVAEGELGAWVAAGCATALERPGSVAVICADAQVPEVSTALAAAGFSFSVLGAPESPILPKCPAMAVWQSCRSRWPRDLSSTTWCWSNRAGSPPARPMACGDFTSRLPARYRGSRYFTQSPCRPSFYYVLLNGPTYCGLSRHFRQARCAVGGVAASLEDRYAKSRENYDQ